MTIQMEPLQQYFQRVHEVKIFESIKRKQRTNCSFILTEQAWSVKNLLNGQNETFHLRDDYRGKSGMAELIRAQGYLPFTWENRKFRLENQMDRAHFVWEASDNNYGL